MSPNYEKVKSFYNSGLWNAERVYNAVIKGWITSDEYTQITGKPYDPPEIDENGTDKSLEQRVNDVEGDVEQIITSLEGVAT